MEKAVKSVRLPADLACRVETYASDQDISESDALRRLVLYGLDYEETGYHETLYQIEDAVTTPFWRRLFQ